jgi:exopolysaccharide biosynthesis polyprenyl glycosylphosphotransferase
MQVVEVAVQPAAREAAGKGYEWLRRPRRYLALLDGLSGVIALLSLVAFNEWRPMLDSSAVLTAFLGLGLILLFTLVLGFRNGQYTSTRRLSRWRDVGSLVAHLTVATSVVALLALLSKGFFTGTLDFSRLLVGASIAVFLGLASASRIGLALRQRARFMRGEAYCRCLVLGDGPAAHDFVRFVTKRPWLGVACVGHLEYISPEESDDSAREHTRFSIGPTYEGFENLDRIWCDSGASEVVVALEPEDHHLLAGITKVLSLAHIPFRVVPSLFEESYKAAELLGYGELPVVDVDVDPLTAAERWLKRVLDVTVSALVLICGCIPALVLVLAIKIDSRGPVLYMQKRIGKNGRRFDMYKFRTMIVNAEQLVDGLADANEKSSNGQLFKIKNDPRITRVGRFLRKLSLDELPQIINVLKGEMSWVGPRPPLPREVENYSSEHYVRLRGLPGMTGLWQVSGRSDLSFEQMVKLDKFYLDNWSIRMDLTILAKTILVVFTSRGAY